MPVSTVTESEGRKQVGFSHPRKMGCWSTGPEWKETLSVEGAAPKQARWHCPHHLHHDSIWMSVNPEGLQ